MKKGRKEQAFNWFIEAYGGEFDEVVMVLKDGKAYSRNRLAKQKKGLQDLLDFYKNRVFAIKKVIDEVNGFLQEGE